MNPEDEFPDRQIWARAVEGALKPAEFGTFTTPLIRKSGAVAGVGTMLASLLLTTMRDRKFPVIGVEPPHPAFADIPPETDEYLSFSAGYGEIWNARALRQLVRRADRSFVPEADRRHEGDSVIDVFRPRLRYPARSDREFDLLVESHLNAVRSAFRRCSSLIVALGGSEICETIADGAVAPGWRGAKAFGFEPEHQAFRTLSVAETIADLNDAIDGLRGLNPGMSIILMISPEPPEATAMPAHVVTANAHGKAVLRVAMEEVAWRPGVSYFPAFEIAATLGNSGLGADGRSLAAKAIQLIEAALIEASEGGAYVMTKPERPQSAAAEIAEESEDDAAASNEAEAATPTVETAPVRTTQEKRAAGLAAHAAKVASRVAARAAAAAARAAPPPPPPPPPKRAIATVVDSYTGMVPARGKGKKVAKGKAQAEAAKAASPSPDTTSTAEKAAAVRKPKANPRVESEVAQERKERRAAREAKRAERLQASPQVTAASEESSQPASGASAAVEAKAPRREGRGKASRANRPRQRKAHADTPSNEAAAASETPPAASRPAKTGSSEGESSAATAPRGRRRAKASGEPTSEKSTE